MSPHPLVNKVRAARSKLSQWALVPGVALMCSPVFAALPTMPTPGTDMNGNAVAAGDWMGSMSAWFKAGLAILGLVLLAFMFFKVVGGEAIITGRNRVTMTRVETEQPSERPIRAYFESLV